MNRPAPPAPVTEPTLLAAVPPMEWISARWVPSTAGPELLTIVPAIGFQYFESRALWVEPIAGVTVLDFNVAGDRWACKGPIPAELFRLAMIDVSELTIVSIEAFGCPAQIQLEGPTCTVLLGGKHLTSSEYLDAQQRRVQARQHGRRAW